MLRQYTSPHRRIAAHRQPSAVDGQGWRHQVRITEPTTMLTDYALAAVNLACAQSLFRASRLSHQTSVRLWAVAFTTTAAAAICGGTFHGFGPNVSKTWQFVLWKSTLYAIGLTSLCMLAGTIVASVRNPLRRWLLRAAGLKFVVYALWIARHDDFRYAIYDYAPAMLTVLLLQTRAVANRRAASARWIIAGVLLSFGAAGIQQSELTLHKHFNHNDLYHVVQMGACYVLFRGASRLTDRC